MSQPQSNLTEGQVQARKLASADDLRMIITGEDASSVEKLDTVAKAIGQLLSLDLTTSQIRNVFGEVRTIELAVKSDTNVDLAGNYRRLIMLKPKLAYQVGREKMGSKKRLTIEVLATILTDSINLVDNNKIYFGNFVLFFEAILAYHKYFGGQS